MNARLALPTEIPSQKLSPHDLSTLAKTPGQNNYIYGTSPGGSKLVYSRDQLMHLATSPLATILSSTPPQGSLSNFPDLLRSNQKAAVGTTDQTDRSPSKLAQQPQQQKQKQAAPPATTEESELQFAMD